MKRTLLFLTALTVVLTALTTVWFGLWWGLVVGLFWAALISVNLASLVDQQLDRLIGIVGKIGQGEYLQDVRRGSKFGLDRLEEALETAGKRLTDHFNRLTTDQRQVSAILSNMAEGVLATNQAGKIILANPAVEKMFDVIEPEIIGKTVREAIYNNEIAGLFELTAKSGQPIESEIEIVTPLTATFLAHASPMAGQGVVCVLFDISELRKLEKYRSEFVANVSHELKTPLTAIRNYVETLLNGAIDDRDNNRKFLEKIDKHAVNLSALIDDILELSRLEGKKELGPFVKVDIAGVVKRAVETISGKAAKKGVGLATRCDGGGRMISGIEDHIYRAIVNLLENAVNYTPAGGRIEVACRFENNKILVTVTDTGIGIAAEHLPRLFERFYRVDQARSRELGGTGLGLAIVKHVMNTHNGSVEVESEIGKGSKFTLIFPA